MMPSLPAHPEVGGSTPQSAEAKTDDLPALKLEVLFMTKLDHPNILKLYEIFDAASRLYLVLELASGGDVFDRIAERGSYTEVRNLPGSPHASLVVAPTIACTSPAISSLSPQVDASKVTKELLSALAHVHAKGVVHRDLKPENLLCASDAHDAPIKVADFGLAVHGGKREAATPSHTISSLMFATRLRSRLNSGEVRNLPVSPRNPRNSHLPRPPFSHPASAATSSPSLAQGSPQPRSPARLEALLTPAAASLKLPSPSPSQALKLPSPSPSQALKLPSPSPSQALKLPPIGGTHRPPSPSTTRSLSNRTPSPIAPTRTRIASAHETANPPRPPTLSLNGTSSGAGGRRLCGTPSYMAPEAVEHMRYGPACDLYAPQTLSPSLHSKLDLQA